LSSLWIFLGRSTADELQRRKAMSRRFISPTFHFPDVSFARCFICPLFHLPAVCARRFGLPHFPQASAPSQIQSSDKSEHSIGTVRTLECDDLSSLWIFLGRSTADEFQRRKAMSRRFISSTFHLLDFSSPRRFISPLFHLPAVCARRFGLPHFPQVSAPSQIQSSDKSEHSIGTVRTLECDDLSSLWIFLG
jgi:hypothetical protein